MLTNADITIYNSYWDNESGYQKYVRTVIKGVNWHSSVDIQQDSNGLMTADIYKIRIPIDADFGGKEYLDPIAWKSLEDKTGYWTIKNDDVIINKATDVEVTMPSEIEKLSSEVATVFGWSDNRRGIKSSQHWRIEGK
jgi:hypothetical protein